MSDADKTLKILLQVQSDIADLQKVVGGLDQLRGKLKESGDAGAGLNSVLAGIVGGAVAGGIGVIANALASIPQALQQFGEEWRRVDERVQTASDDLNEQIHIWDVLAQNATKFSDVVSLAGDGVAELTRLTKDLEKAQSRQVGLVETTFEKISQMVNVAAGLDISTSPKADDIAGAQANLTKGLDDFIEKQDKAQAATDKWLDDLNRPPSAALRDLSDELTRAEANLQSIDRHTLEGQKAYEDQIKTVSRLRDEVDKVGGAAEKASNQASNFSLKQRQAELDSARLRGENVSAAQHQLSVEEKIAELTKSQSTALKDGRITQDQINALAESQVSSAEQTKAATGGTVAHHRETIDLLAEEKLLLGAIKADISNVESNPFLTIDAKQVALAQLLPQAIKQLNDQIDSQRSKITGTALDPAQINQVRSAIQRDSAEISKLQTQLKTLTFGGQLQTGLTQWVNQFGTTASQVSNIITSTLGTAISGVSSAITGLITRTTTWGQAFAQVATSIIQNIIQIVLQWAISRAVMALLNLAFGKAESAAINQEAAASAAAWGPAATAASIASYGAAAGFGLIAYLAAIGTGTAATVAAASGGGFEAGGYTGDGPRSAIAGVVHRGEWVNDAVTVKRAGGPAFFENLKVAINRGGFERGGSVGGQSNSAAGRSNRQKLRQTLIFFDAREMAKHITKTKEWETSVVHLSNSRGGHLRT